MRDYWIRQEVTIFKDVGEWRIYVRGMWQWGQFDLDTCKTWAVKIG
jgi:hypothetical protein